MNDKVVLKQKLKNGFLAILLDEYRYDGSVVVEANNEEELETKINAAVRNDDRWITMHGVHLLIKGDKVIGGPARFRGMSLKNGKLKGNKVLPTSASTKGGSVTSATSAAKDNRLIRSSKAAQKAYDKARRAEPKITKDLVNISKGLGMEMTGLKYSVKTASSVESKIKRKKPANEPDDKYIRRMGDLVRYTQMGKHSDLGTNTVKTIDALKKNGYKVTKVDNKYLDKNSDYKGIHLDVVSPTGQKFELQIHSKESMDVKNKLHPIYEKSRMMPNDSPKRLELENQMRAISATLPMPKGIENVKNYEER